MGNVLAKAADSAACAMLNDIGSEGTRLGVWTMWNPKVALVPLAVGGLSYLANRLLCEPMDFDPSGGNDERIDGCRKGIPGIGYAIEYTREDGTWGNASPARYQEIIAVKDLVFWNGGWGYELDVLHLDGNVMNFRFPVSDDKEIAAQTKYRLGVPEGQCTIESNPDAPVDPTPDLPPYEYTDPETNCNYTLKFEGFAQITPNGEARPVWTISGGETTRASGGVIGGCNLSPTIYVSGGEGGDGGDDGPVPPIPYPEDPEEDDEDGVPWWAKAIAAGAAGALLNQIAEGIKDLNSPSFNEGSFTLTAPCDVDENGDPQTRTWEFLPGSFEERMNAHQVALMEIMQQHLNWKTPTCTSEKPALEGEWVTTRWESLEKMEHSGRRLRKLFRYRTKSTRDLGQLSAYWQNFTWQSGDVCVRHKGAWWGDPQVWAASPEEGQRVIRFAAAEAGIDPDQAGEWVISSSSAPRYGMSGTMKVQQNQGYPWVAKRSGAEWPNYLARPSDP